MSLQNEIADRVLCPCCGYPTLHEAAAYEICELCNWEDDGQGDHNANKVLGGPNGSYSLAAARLNFRAHLSMYATDDELRSSPDSPRQREAKRALMAAFDRLAVGGSDVLPEIAAQEAILANELRRRIAVYEEGIAKDR
jgi:hypothetical protein